jgi:hypothetical protein
MKFILNLENSKFWIPEKIFFVILLPPSLTNRMKGLSGFNPIKLLSSPYKKAVPESSKNGSEKFQSFFFKIQKKKGGKSEFLY